MTQQNTFQIWIWNLKKYLKPFVSMSWKENNHLYTVACRECLITESTFISKCSTKTSFLFLKNKNLFPIPAVTLQPFLHPREQGTQSLQSFSFVLCAQGVLLQSSFHQRDDTIEDTCQYAHAKNRHVEWELSPGNAYPHCSLRTWDTEMWRIFRVSTNLSLIDWHEKTCTY